MKYALKKFFMVVTIGMSIAMTQTIRAQETFCIDFRPETLNIDSCGVLTTVYIEPVGYTPADIDVSTILLNGEVAPLFVPTCFSADVTCEPGVNERMVKFNRDEVAAILPLGEEVVVTITGALADGTSFTGTDIIRVIEREECPGDFDFDGDVDSSDGAKLKRDFGRSNMKNPCSDTLPCNGDFDCDNDVDSSDGAKLKRDFGRSNMKNPCPPII